VTRAFGAWWDGGDGHVPLVLAVYKKGNESDFWSDEGKCENRSQKYISELHQRHSSGELERVLANLDESDDGHVVGQ